MPKWVCHIVPYLKNYDNYEKNETISLQQVLQQFTRDSETGKRKMPNGKRISASVLQHYRHAARVLQQFEQEQQSVINITLAYRPGKALIQQQRRLWKKFSQAFIQYLYQQRRYADQTAAHICKLLTTALNYARLELGLPIGEAYRLLRAPIAMAAPVVLMPEQLAFLIHDYDFERQLPAHLQRSKDLFVFGCTTGLRVSDLMKLKKQQLQLLPEGCYLQLNTQKTGASVHIPLPTYCMSILKRQQRRGSQLLFPPLSNTNFNLHIKEIGRLAGWTHPHPKYRSSKGQLKEQKTKQGKTWAFYQHLTAHTMRRTAITTLLMMGVSEAVVRRISGHAAGSREFFRYVQLAQSYMDQQVKQAYQRISEDPGWYRRTPGH